MEGRGEKKKVVNVTHSGFDCPVIVEFVSAAFSSGLAVFSCL